MIIQLIMIGLGLFMMILLLLKDDSRLMVLFYIGIIIAISGLGLMIYDIWVQNTQNELHQQNSKAQIDSWSCEKLGENILTQIKSDNQTLLQYQKDLYHFTCEVKP